VDNIITAFWNSVNSRRG